MILIDFSPVMVSNIMQQIKHNSDLQEDLVRHMVLTSILGYKKKFSDEYGKLVICCDSNKNWRKKHFEFYKANRKSARQNSGLDWHMIFDLLQKIKEELRDNFPYEFIEVPGAEADDVIGVLCKNKSILEKALIVSSDKDMKQLLKYNNVKFYSIYHKTILDVENPEMFLKEHIMIGDSSDGIPNFLSDDDTFLNPNKRQTPIRTKKLQDWLTKDITEFCDNKMKRNFDRNKLLIDLECIPKEIEDMIMFEHSNVKISNGKSLFDYFVRNKLKNLMGDLPNFI